MIDFFGTFRTIMNTLAHIMRLRINLAGFSFSIGSMIIGLFLLSCSFALLKFLINKD